MGGVFIFIGGAIVGAILTAVALVLVVVRFSQRVDEFEVSE